VAGWESPVTVEMGDKMNVKVKSKRQTKIAVKNRTPHYSAPIRTLALKFEATPDQVVRAEKMGELADHIAYIIQKDKKRGKS